MFSLPKRWILALSVAFAAEVAIAVGGRWGGLRQVARGDVDADGVAALGGLLLLSLITSAAVWLARSLVRVQRALHRQDQAIAADASTTHDWLWETDLDFVFTYNSPGVKPLLGYDPDELAGRPVGDLMVPDEVRDDRDWTGLRYVTGWEDVERLWRHRDGQTVPLSGSGVAIRDETGKAIGFRGTRYRPRVPAQAQRELHAARERLEEVLAKGALDIALQPIVNLFTGDLAGAEALARFHDGRSPDVWFREARDAGLSCELEALAFTKALAALEHLPPYTYLSVNASPALILEGGFVQRLLAAGAPLDRLVIEITEHLAINDYPAINGVLAPLRERGVRLAVDDTGAGYASLSHVLQLRPNMIKIDRSLIAHLSSDRARRSLVTALVLLALDIGATVTGEGVETPAELDTLVELGVDGAQGYLLARPTTDATTWADWSVRNWTRPVSEPDPDLPAR